MKKKKQESCETLVRTGLVLLMLVAVCFIVRGGRRLMLSVSSDEVETSKEMPCVVIDAGHGGSKLR